MKKALTYLAVLSLALAIPLMSFAETGSNQKKNYRQYQNQGGKNMKKGTRYFKKSKRYFKKTQSTKKNTQPGSQNNQNQNRQYKK